MHTTSDESLGGLVAQATRQLSDLVRMEVELAKAEITHEVSKIGKGIGMFGGAGATAWLAVVFLSLAAMFGLGEAMPLWAAALCMGVLYAVLAAGFVLAGKSTLGSVSPVPRRTVETLKEDAEWARHPTS